MKQKKKITSIWQFFKKILTGFGFFFLICLVISFTSLPYWGYYWLGTDESKITGEPDYVVLLGGGGMPSESSLMRAYFVYKAATEAPNSNIILSIPGNAKDSSSTASLVAKELMLKGISAERFLFEEQGTNTRFQALQLVFFNSDSLTNLHILLVTSPEHTRRAVKCFKKAGFKNVDALPCFENAIEADLFFDDDNLGDDKLLVPDIGRHTSVRYQFWNHLKYEILIGREIVATTYYKLRGWI